jgi:hypothetical protein
VKYCVPPPDAVNGTSGTVHVSTMGAAVERSTDTSDLPEKFESWLPCRLDRDAKIHIYPSGIGAESNGIQISVGCQAGPTAK